MHIMIHSLQSKLALQSIIWKNSLHQCSLEYPYKGFIWSKISDLRKMKGWLKVMQGQLIFGHLIFNKMRQAILKSYFHNCKFLKLKCSIFGHYFPSYQELYKLILVITVSEKNSDNLPPSLWGCSQQLASDDQSQFLVPHWRLP